MNLLLKKTLTFKFTVARLIVGLLIFCIVIQTAVAENNIWFSNKPPPDNKRSALSGMHGLSSTKGKRGMSFVIQWLRQGDNPLTAKYIQLPDTNNFEFYLYSPAGEETGQFSINSKNAFLTYASTEEGYYNGYLIVKHVSNDTLYVDVAKAEMLNHSCRNGHKSVRKKIGPDTYPNTVPAEIIRERNLSENFHYFASSGDNINYQFSVDGKAVEGARLSFNTQTGWKKILLTDENGNCTFQILQDYFSLWQELNNRKVYNYVIFGETTLPQIGNFNGDDYSFVHYTSSLSDGYRPAKTMYMSMFWAFVVFMTTVIISVAGIFIYKLNRNKIYKEVRFDEKD